MKKEIKLDTKITPKLKEEGRVREVIRHIQRMRKKAGLKPRHQILISYSGSAVLNRVLAKNRSFILKTTKAKTLILKKKPKRVFDVEKEIKIDEEKLWLAIKKVAGL